MGQRHVEEKDDEYRSKFVRDRDRILYSKGFRRLSGKTITVFDNHFKVEFKSGVSIAIER